MSIREDLEKASEAFENASSEAEEIESRPIESSESVQDPTPADDIATPSTEDFPTSPKQEQQSEPAQADTQPPLIAPVHWTKEGKDGFNALPRNIQEVLLKREKDRERGIQKQLEELNKSKRAYGELEQFIAPHVERWGLNGIQPTQVIQQLVAAQDFLNRNPIEGLKWLAKSYGIDFEQLAQGSGVSSHQQSAYQSPLVLQELQEVKARLQQYEQGREAETLNSTVSEIESFATEKDSGGNSLRPYFEEVASEIGNWIQLVRQSKPDASNRDILNEAYDRAVWANPDTRNAMLQMQAKAKESELRRKSNAAANAGKSISGSPGSTVPNSGNASLRERLEAAWNEHYV